MRGLGQMLGHEISQIILGRNKRHIDMTSSRLISHETVTDMDVARALVVQGILGQVNA